MTKTFQLFIVLFVVVVSGCQALPKHRLHQRVISGDIPNLGHTVLLLPTEITAHELQASGQKEEVPEWTAQATKHVIASLKTSGVGGLKLVQVPKLTDEETRIVREHVGLYDKVAGSVIWSSNPAVSSAWTHKLKNFDYTIGDGLSFLADKTGVDKALLIVGEDTISSSGRQATFIFAAAFGVAIPMGYAIVNAGIVDLRTGDLLWMNTTANVMSLSLREQESSDKMVGVLFEEYPGIENYKEALKSVGKK